MFKRIGAHIRRQPVAFIALFFALGGSSLAANKYLTASDQIPQGDLAGSTYGDPVIATGAVTNGKLANSSLTVSPGKGLTGGGSIPLGGTGTLSVDPTAVQSRVSGACSSGQVIASVNQDGSVSCSGGRVIAGYIAFDGTIDSGSGFSASRISTGLYLLTFPAGTWRADTSPAVTITGVDFFNVFSIVSVSSNSDGSSTVEVEESGDTGTATPTNGSFSFIAAQT